MRFIFFAFFILFSAPAFAQAPAIESKDITLPYPDGRRGLEIRVTYPLQGENLPVIIWSHGAYGSAAAYQPLARGWAEAGYAVIQPTHADSLKYGRKTPMIGFTNWDERPGEISYIIDRLPVIAQELPGFGRVADIATVGVGGHSFGAHTAQLVAGLTTVRPMNFRNEKRRSFEDGRPKAFVAISPQGKGRAIDDRSYASVTRPILFVTGDKDDNPKGKGGADWRMEAVRLTGARDKYLLYIQGAHHGFGGISGRADSPVAGPADPVQVDMVLAVTRRFWDAYLKNDAAALDFLNRNDLAQRSGGVFSLGKQ